jgi:two-component system response regulator NreC
MTRHAAAEKRGGRQMDVLLADDRAEVRSAIRLLLEEQRGVDVVAEAADLEQLMLALEATQPDVVLLDWELPGSRSGGRPTSHSKRLMALMRRLCPGMLIIVMSGAPEVRGEAERCGADAFVSKADPPEALLAVLA